jgi:hypothetical protein
LGENFRANAPSALLRGSSENNEFSIYSGSVLLIAGRPSDYIFYHIITSRTDFDARCRRRLLQNIFSPIKKISPPFACGELY